MRLETRLLLVFLAATLVPVAVTVWIATTLLERSLDHGSTRELDTLSKSLEKTGREFYLREGLWKFLRAFSGSGAQGAIVIKP